MKPFKTSNKIYKLATVNFAEYAFDLTDKLFSKTYINKYGDLNTIDKYIPCRNIVCLKIKFIYSTTEACTLTVSEIAFACGRPSLKICAASSLLKTPLNGSNRNPT